MLSKLFIALLSKEVWTQYSYKITEDFFPDELKSLFRTLKYAHGKYDSDLSIDELGSIHFSIHPSMTESSKSIVKEVLASLEDVEVDYNPSVVKDVINQAWKQEVCTRIMNAACRIADGQEDDWSAITNLVDTATKDLTELKEYDSISITELMDIHDTIKEDRWEFNLAELQEATDGLPKTGFGIVAARPNGGKTAFWISLVCHTGGFVPQGAKVHIWRNEESYTMVARRLLSSLLGVPYEQAHLHVDKYKELLSTLSGDVRLLKDDITSGGDIKDIEEYVINNAGNIDILILDQLDNVTINGASANDDHAALGKLYAKARELSNKYGISIIGITQAGAEAEGKRFYGFNELYGSKTNKAAMGDYVFCIGQQARNADEPDSGFRWLNFAKNKLKGPHRAVTYLLDHKLSRMNH